MLKRFFILCLLSNNLYAQCEPSVGAHFPSETPPNYYGNSRTDTFNCAVTGTNELTSAQLSERAELLPESLDDRFYIRLGGNFAAEGITSAKTSGTDPTTMNATIKDQDVKTASNNVELGFGYIWKDFAFDIEWLGLKSVDYSSTLENITPNMTFNTTVSGDALLFNLYWIFKDIYNIQFYGLICGGVTKNKSTSVLAGGEPISLNKNGISYGAGVGGRFNIISKLYADMALRYILLGKVKYLARNPAENISMELKANRTWLGVSVRIVWLI